MQSKPTKSPRRVGVQKHLQEQRKRRRRVKMTLPRASLRSRWGLGSIPRGADDQGKKSPGLAALPEDVSDRKGECRVPAGTRPGTMAEAVPSSNNQCHLRGSWPGTGQRPGTAREATAPSMANHQHHHHRPWWVGGPRCRLIGAVDGGVETAWNQLLFRLMFLLFFFISIPSFHRIPFRQVPHRAFHWLT